MFDLPTNTKAEKKAYMRFRKHLLNDGFTMLQYSVYVRHCASGENGDVHRNRIKTHLPKAGKVSILTITEKQYSMMITYWGRAEQPRDPPPAQLELF